MSSSVQGLRRSPYGSYLIHLKSHGRVYLSCSPYEMVPMPREMVFNCEPCTLCANCVLKVHTRFLQVGFLARMLVYGICPMQRSVYLDSLFVWAAPFTNVNLVV